MMNILAEDKISALAELIVHQLEPGDIISLSGDLGVGKTTLARAMITMLTAEKNIPSPTFSLVNYYQSDFWHSNNKDAHENVTILHVDFYRLVSPDESEALDIFADQNAVIFIEWLERGVDKARLQADKEAQLWQIIIDDSVASDADDCRHYNIILPARDFSADITAQFARLKQRNALQ